MGAEDLADECDDGFDWPAHGGDGATGHLDEDWDSLLQTLPPQWQAKAWQFGAVRRQLRNFSDVGSALRVLLIHLADGCSLQETSERARSGGLADVSDVALFKRLRRCGPWFQWITHELMSAMALPRKQATPCCLGARYG